MKYKKCAYVNIQFPKHNKLQILFPSADSPVVLSDFKLPSRCKPDVRTSVMLPCRLAVIDVSVPHIGLIFNSQACPLTCRPKLRKLPFYRA
jgi:hypothetical protein